MKDVLKMMRFDFLTVKPMAMTIIIIVGLFTFAASLFFSPVICSYISFIAVMFVFPLQGVADKSNFNKLYGTLPIDRKNITRSRFLYIFLVFFLFEIIELVLAFISRSLELYKILPNQKSEMMEFIKNSFENTLFQNVAIVGIFAGLCLILGYMQMMGQILGKEHEFKVLIITMGVIVLLIFGFLMLSDHDIIPTFKLPGIPGSTAGRVILAVVLNIAAFGVCILFGEITANKLAKREL